MNIDDLVNREGGEVIEDLCRLHGLSHVLKMMADHCDREATKSGLMGCARSAQSLHSLARKIRKAREIAFPHVQGRNPHK